MFEQEITMPRIRDLTDNELNSVSGGWAMGWAINYSSAVAGFAIGATYGAAGGPGGAVVGGIIGVGTVFAIRGIATIGYSLGSQSLSSRFRGRVRDD